MEKEGRNSGGGVEVELQQVWLSFVVLARPASTSSTAVPCLLAPNYPKERKHAAWLERSRGAIIRTFEKLPGYGSTNNSE